MNNKPNLFIVGAAKSGTTSIYKFLESFNEFHTSKIKEPNFFLTDSIFDTYKKEYTNKPAIESSRFPIYTMLHEKDYLKLFINSNTKIKFFVENSNFYLYSKEAAENIYKFNPKAKILIILRNPIERAFSHFIMNLKRGAKCKSSFIEDIKNDLSNNNTTLKDHSFYIELGLYYNQIQRYLNIFPHKNIKILLFDDMKKDYKKFYNDILVFCNIHDKHDFQNIIYNKAFLPKNQSIHRFITKTGILKIISKVLGKNIKNMLKKIYYKPKDLQIKKEDFDFLISFFRDDIKKTAQLINRDLNSWLEF